jgi:predicted flap endonuclease-1-like 5' DNA nuclease
MGGDRLEIIQGIGPVIVRRLNRAGINTFQALSQLSARQLKEVIGPPAARSIDAESVIAQAKKLAGERRSHHSAG